MASALLPQHPRQVAEWCTATISAIAGVVHECADG